jgi:cobalt-zinc-cadmium efflux system protein
MFMGAIHIERTLKIAILLTTIFFVVEIFGGIFSGSLSLLGDAGHMFRDVFALIVSLGAINVSKKLPTESKTFGYHRVEILAALINGILLLLISAWILYEAYQRFLSPHPIGSSLMFFVALLGLAVNLYIVFKLHGSEDLNVKSAFLHVLTDTIASIAVIFAAIWIFFTGQTIIDPILSVFIAIIISISAFNVIKDSIWILLEYTPQDVNPVEVIKDINNIVGVEGVHDVHLWSLCSHINVLEAHIYTKEPDMGKIEIMKREIKHNLQKYDIKHTTLEFECEECFQNCCLQDIKH